MLAWRIQASLRFAALMISGALGMLALETVSLARGSSYESAQEAEEVAITHGVHWGQLYRNQLYFVFDGSSPGCRMYGGRFTAHGMIELTRHGLLLSLLGSSVESSLTQDEEKSRAVAEIRTENCIVEVAVRKYVRDSTSDWITVRPLRRKDIEHLDLRDSRLAANNLLPDSQGQLQFLFGTIENENCPRGFGNLMIRSHSLLASIESGFSGLALPTKSGPFDRKFELIKKDCKYELEVRFHAEVDDGVFVPVRARHLGGDDFQR